MIEIKTGPSPTPEVYFEAVHRSFLCASQHAHTTEVDIAIGQAVMRLRFAGCALLRRLLPALAHLQVTPASEPDLIVCVWDSESTQMQVPPPPWPPTAYGARGVIDGYNDARFYTVYQPGVDILHMYDAQRRLALYWVDSGQRIPYWESSFPMRTIVHWWSRGRSLQLMHAAAVGYPTGGVLLAGKSGSGKSTTALACLASEMVYAGDDYILADTESLHVYSMYSTAKLEADNVQRLPRLRELISNPDRLDAEKALIYLHEHFPARLSRGFPICAILLPHVARRQMTTVRPASPMECLQALAPTTIFHLPRATDVAIRKMRQLAQRVPGYHLDLGDDLAQIPTVMRNVISARKTTP